MNKLSKTAKKLDSFCKFFYWLILIVNGAALVLVFLGIALLGQHPNMTQFLTPSLAFGSIRLTLAAGSLPASHLIASHLSATLLLSVAYLVIFLVMLRSVRNILAPLIRCEPFHQTVAVNTKKLAKLAILYGIVVNVSALLDAAVFYHGYEIPSLLVSDKIAAVSVNYSVDLSFLLIAAVLYLLSFVFRYGEELQQLSDETL